MLKMTNEINIKCFKLLKKISLTIEGETMRPPYKGNIIFVMQDTNSNKQRSQAEN